eukprot:Opistho-2@5757
MRYPRVSSLPFSLFNVVVLLLKPLHFVCATRRHMSPQMFFSSAPIKRLHLSICLVRGLVHACMSVCVYVVDGEWSAGISVRHRHSQHRHVRTASAPIHCARNIPPVEINKREFTT